MYKSRENNKKQVNLSYILQSERFDSHFLVLLNDLFTEACATFAEFTKDKSIFDFLKIIEMVFRDFIELFLPVIARVCVYEMHAASKNQQLKGETPEDRFLYFIDVLSQPETIQAILKKYPVLSDFIEKVYRNYIHARLELFSRLVADFSEIERLFPGITKQCRLIHIEMLGDRHNQGRCVCSLEFSDTKKTYKVVYKPRSLCVDQAFLNLLNWLSAKKIASFYHYKLLDKSDYGWCEYIEYLPCQDKNELRQFYYRLGILLGVSHLLGSTDIHAENIIAHGAYPMLIDHECCLRPNLNPFFYRHLLTDTHLLPARYMARDDYAGFDLSGIAGIGDEEAPYTRMAWKNVGTDQMVMIRENVKFAHKKNLPYLNNETVNPLDYYQQITDGFSDFFDIILKYKTELLGNSTPLHYFENVKIRVILRATQIYSKLLYESFHPKLLYDRTAFDNHFYWLQNNAVPGDYVDNLLPAEIADLQSGDIPYFSCLAKDVIIYDSCFKPLDIPVFYSAYQWLKKNVAEYLDAKDVLLQKLLIENSFTALRFTQVGACSLTAKTFCSAKPVSTVETIKQRALALAQQQLEILKQYMFVADDKIFWSSIDVVSKDVWSAGFTGIDLYNGTPGIILTFGYAAHVLKNKNYREIAELGLKKLLQKIAAQSENCFSDIGAFSGLAGVLYVLSKMKTWFVDLLVDSAIERLLQWAPQLIATDKKLDVIGGSAGFIAVLFSIYKTQQTKESLSLLRLACDHILSAYPRPEKFSIYRHENQQQPLIGFSHGTTGIAWALLKVVDVVKDQRIMPWINAALNYERQHFSAAHNNWPDFRKQDQQPHNKHDAFLTAWCHGSPGIGMARLAMREYSPNEAIDKEILASIASTLKSGFGGLTNLCHGDLGNLEFLLQVAQRFDQSYESIFYANVETLLAQIEKSGVILEIPGTLALPGLMTGIAGVVYQLLRITDQNVPAVLLLE